MIEKNEREKGGAPSVTEATTVTSADTADPTNYTQRSERLLKVRNEKSRKNINEFVRLNVFINNGDSLTVVANKGMQIQDFAKQLESGIKIFN